MGWDFSTEPEFQKKLDWVEQFCREEVEPLDLVFPYAVRSKDPKIKALVKPLQDQVKEQGLWALFLDKDLGGPGYGQLKLGLLNEILGRYGSAPQIFGAAAPDTGNMEMLAAYGTEEQKKRWLYPLMKPGDLVCLFDDRTAGGIGSASIQDLRRARWRRVGDQRREVVHQCRPGGRYSLRHVHQRHVRRAAQYPPGSRSCPSHGLTITSSIAMSAFLRITYSAQRMERVFWRNGAWAEDASTTRCGLSRSASSLST